MVRSCAAASSCSARPASNDASSLRSSSSVHGSPVFGGICEGRRAKRAMRSSAVAASYSARTICGRWYALSAANTSPLSGSTPFASERTTANACVESMSSSPPLPGGCLYGSERMYSARDDTCHDLRTLGKKPMRFRPRMALLLGCMVPSITFAQAVSDSDLQKRANGILTLMGFALTPDVTTGALSFTDQTAGNPYFRQTSVSGGGTLKAMPLYLEGTLGYGRYDPSFASSDDPNAPRIAVKWNSLLGTGGVGWDFPVAQDLVLRPIVNVSLGRVESEGSTGSAAPPAAA